MKNASRRSGSSLLALLAFVASTASAQTMPVKPTLPPEDEALVLSPFLVDASKDTGYRAENTLNGSRLNTSLKDVASNVSVFTAEFIEDMAAHSLMELVNYDANTQPDEFDTQGATNSNSFLTANPNERNTFISRGLSGGFSRNFQRAFAPTDTYNVSRADLSKGPNGVLFGSGGIGGVINATTNASEFNRNKNSLELQAGSWDLKRAVLDINRVLVKDKLALRLSLLEHDAGGYQYYSFHDQRRGTLSLGYRPTQRISLRASYEKGYSHRSNQRPFGPQDNISLWVAARKPIATLASTNLPTAQSGISVANANSNLIFIDGPLPTDGALYNISRAANSTNFADARNSPAFVANYTGRRLYDDPSLGELAVSNRIGVSGPDTIAENDFHSLDLSAEGKLLDNLAFSVSFFHEYMDTYGQNTNAPSLKADPNPFIGGVQTGTGATSPFSPTNRLGVNPHAGQYYIDDVWRLEDDYSKQTSIHATLAYDLDFSKHRRGWVSKLGSHRIAGLVQRRNIVEDFGQYFEALSWTDLNSGKITGLNIGAPENARNQVQRRRYVTMGDWKNFTVGAFPHNMTVAAPQLGSGATIKTAWLPRTAGTIGNDEIRRDARMGVIQSHFFNRHLVTTFGYRTDTDRTESALVLRDSPANNPNGATDINGNGMQNEWVVRPDLTREVSDTKAVSKNFGAVYHVNDHLDLVYNHSSGINLPNRSVRVAPGDHFYQGEHGDTKEVSLRFSLFQDRLSGSVTHFDTIEKDRFFSGGVGTQGYVNYALDILSTIKDSSGRLLMAQSEVDALRPNFSGTLGNATSKGYECQLTGNLTKNLSVRLSYTTRKSTIANLHNDVIQYEQALTAQFVELLGKVGATVNDRFTPAGQPLTAVDENGNVGRTIAAQLAEVNNTIILEKADREFGYGQQPQRFSGTVRYVASEGRLKGLSLGGTFRWAEPKAIARIIDYNDANGNFVINDGELPVDSKGQYIVNQLAVIRGKAETQLDMFATYRFKTPFAKGFKSSIQLNVYNVLNNDDVIPSRMNNAMSGYAQFRWREPRSFRVTFRTEF